MPLECHVGGGLDFPMPLEIETGSGRLRGEMPAGYVSFPWFEDDEPVLDPNGWILRDEWDTKKT
jgi:hypothetical protein